MDGCMIGYMDVGREGGTDGRRAELREGVRERGKHRWME